MLSSIFERDEAEACFIGQPHNTLTRGKPCLTCTNEKSPEGGARDLSGKCCYTLRNRFFRNCCTVTVISMTFDCFLSFFCFSGEDGHVHILVSCPLWGMLLGG
ncbi:unnamed protein product, partial [Discosporangium mesarthrocarpum]